MQLLWLVFSEQRKKFTVQVRTLATFEIGRLIKHIERIQHRVGERFARKVGELNALILNLAALLANGFPFAGCQRSEKILKAGVIPVKPMELAAEPVKRARGLQQCLIMRVRKKQMPGMTA